MASKDELLPCIFLLPFVAMMTGRSYLLYIRHRTHPYIHPDPLLRVHCIYNLNVIVDFEQTTTSLESFGATEPRVPVTGTDYPSPRTFQDSRRDTSVHTFTSSLPTKHKMH